MKNRFLIILSLLFLISCSIKNKKVHKIENNNLSITKVYSYQYKVFDVSIDYSIGYNNFVFSKSDNSFSSSILIAVQIFDMDNESIIFQESWKETIIAGSFEDTRSKEKKYDFSKKVSLNPGTYRLKILTQDIDNNNTYSINEKIDLSNFTGFGQSFLYMYSEHMDAVPIKDSYTLQDSTDTFKLKFQFFHDSETIDDLSLTLSSNDFESKDLLKNIKMNEDGFYSISFAPIDNVYGHFTIKMEVADYSFSRKIEIIDKNNVLWTNDVGEIVGIMRYILDSSEMKIISELNNQGIVEYVSEYWNKKDPDPSTGINELLIEFSLRIKYVKGTFGDFGSGWKSDRGRIYIVYGSPEKIDRFSSKTDGLYEVWTYPNGLTFRFLDRNRFGNFVLVYQGYL